MPEFEQKQDIIEQAVQGERKFLRGLTRKEYKTAWGFCLAYTFSGLYHLLAAIGLTALIVGYVKMIQKEALTFFNIIGPTLFLFACVTIGTLGVRVSKKLLCSLKKKRKKFKQKAYLWVSFFTLFEILLLIYLCLIFLKTNFIF